MATGRIGTSPRSRTAQDQDRIERPETGSETPGFRVLASPSPEEAGAPEAEVGDRPDPAPDDDARRLETVGRLTAGVAHDFNNMLSVILVSAGELELDLRDPAQRERASEIRAAAERGARLTRQLLTYSRPERAEPGPVDLNVAARDAGQLLARTIGEEVELLVDPAAGLPRVLLRPGQAEQILVNLATNARDAMPRGGTITIRTRPQDVGVGDSILDAGWHVCLTVSDNGAGMPAAVAERALEPFFTTKDRGRGTGLGLATVAEITRAAGGDVRLESRSGEGTTVSVYLPAVRTDGTPLSGYGARR